MEPPSTIERLLVGSPWRCIPVFTSAPAILEAQFFGDKTGLTTYQLGPGPGRHIPDTFDVEWEWQWSESTPNLLDIVWSDGTTARVEFEAVDVSFTAHNRSGGPNATFASKLLLSAHLFPRGGRFPDGWPREYFGYPQETTND